MKQFYFTLILLTLGFQYFFAQTEFPTLEFDYNIVIDNTFYTDKPSSIFSADIDGDGDMDVLTSSRDDDRIAWFENLDGMGAFSKLKIISSTADRAQSVYAADIDGDGHMDILSAADFQNEIAWYRNSDGLGTFSNKILINDLQFGQDYASEIIAKDLDSDGDMDVVTSGSDGLAWYENIDGQGNFEIRDFLSGNQLINAFSIAVEDLDNDGDVDIIGASSFSGDPKVVFYENLDGQGNFSSENIIADNMNDFVEVIVSDIDSDGFKDIIYSSTDDGEIHWSRNIDGQGSFGSEQLITDNFNNGFLGVIYAEDIDEDGDNDVISSLNNGTIAWFENTDSMGNFATPQVLSNEFAGRIFMSDLNGDAHLDMLVTQSSNRRAFWLRNVNGQATFASAQTLTYAAIEPIVSYAVDIDSDNDLDVVIASRLDKKVSWQENIDGMGTYGLPKDIYEFDTNGSITNTFIEDIDGNGTPDIIATGDSGELVTLVNFGSGDFIIQQNIAPSSVDRELFSADLDNDGLNDIISIQASPLNTLSWYKSTGFGFGSEQVISNSFFQGNLVYCADMDGDNDIDIVVGSSINDRVSWFENTNGLGNFSSENVVTNAIDSPETLRIADINGDGFNDIAVSSSEENRVFWIQNSDGTGNFAAPNLIFQNPFGIRSLEVTDLDNDGDMDVVSSTRFGSKALQWFQNIDGNGTFEAPEDIVNVDEEVSFISSGDIDNSGLQDILFVIRGENKVAWVKNKGKRNIINGTVRLDLDANGCDTMDLHLSNFMVVAESANDTIATLTQANGYYEMTTLEGDFNIEVENTLPSYISINPMTHNANFMDLGNTDSDNDFCLETTQAVEDLGIDILPLDQARPGFDTTYQLVYTNVGTSSVDGNINLQFNDAMMSYLFTDYYTISEAANELNFEFFGLNPFESRTILLEFNILPPPQVNDGDIIEMTAEVLPLINDATETDNTFLLEQVVVNSFDPNDKQVLQGETITIDETGYYLDYLIRFQNTGSASAIMVLIEDVLDVKLDWRTLQVTSASHNNRVQITDGNLVEFFFDNINLPPQIASEEQSQGYIAFRIKPKPDVVVGDIISGTANIFFDFNAPITTNTVNTQIVEPLSIDEVSAETVKLYPNPARNTIQITSSQVIEALTVIDINGRALESLEISTKDYSLDISNLSKGVYFIEIQSGESKVTKKFIKN